jgi:mannose-6-phosphate isomerase-like protein (cupin superfamily)
LAARKGSGHKKEVCVVAKAGDVFENPVTGERAVVRLGSEDSDEDRAIVDLDVRPGGAVAGEHVHPVTEESFTVEQGQVGFRIDGREVIPELNQRQTVPAGVVHDWWNAGDEEAHVIVEYNHRAARFEEMIGNLFGLAQDGKTNSKGMPNNLLQGALFAREFSDVIIFTKPPPVVQRVLYSVLAFIGWALGYKGSYPKYSAPKPPSGEVAGPPSTTRVAGGAFAVAASLLLASLFLLRGMRRPPNSRR